MMAGGAMIIMVVMITAPPSRTLTNGHFWPWRSRSDSYFPDISGHFGGLAFGAFQKAPKTVRL